MFSFNWLVIIWKGRGSLEVGRPRSRGWKNFGRRWIRRVRGLENWTISWTSYVYHLLLNSLSIALSFSTTPIFSFEKQRKQINFQNNLLSVPHTAYKSSKKKLLNWLLRLAQWLHCFLHDSHEGGETFHLSLVASY